MSRTVAEPSDNADKAVRMLQSGPVRSEEPRVSNEPSTPDQFVAPRPGWRVRNDIRHERIVWLAARPELSRIHRRWWHAFTRALRANNQPRRNGWIPGSSEGDDMSASLQRASIIVDGLATRFSPEERDVVRHTGLLPNWFWPTYLQEFDSGKRR